MSSTNATAANAILAIIYKISLIKAAEEFSAAFFSLHFIHMF